MQLTGDVVQSLVAHTSKPVQVVVDGRDVAVAPAGWTPVPPPPLNKVQPLTVHSLTGLLRYIEANVDALECHELMLHVKSHDCVELISELAMEDAGRQRERLRSTYVTAAFKPGQTLQAGKWMALEEAQIALRAGVVHTEERDELLKLLSSIKDGQVSDATDDGVTQRVNVARGVQLVGTAQPKAFWSLQPFRTFSEVAQPIVLFALRLRPNDNGLPMVSLWEADGERWKQDAINSIVMHLDDAGTDVQVIG